MKAIILLNSLFLFVTITVLNSVAFAESGNASVLRGLAGVGVDIAYSANSNWNTLSKKDVQTEVELRLRRAGIKVYSFNPYDPHLKVMFMVCDTGSQGHYILFTSITLVEQIVPSRKVKLRNNVLVGGTWESENTAYLFSGISTMRYLLDNVDTLIDQFINDYLAVNS